MRLPRSAPAERWYAEGVCGSRGLLLSKASRLERYRRFLTHVHELLGLEVGIVLWDGSTVPASWPADRLAVAFADENVIAALLRYRNFDALANLWSAKRVDIRNGTMFDLFKLRPKMRSREFRRRVDKKLAVSALAPFLFLPRGPWPLDDRKAKNPSDGSYEENKENISYHYDLSNKFYSLFLDKEMVYSCGYAKDWANGIDQMQQDKLEMICRKLRLKPGDRFLDIGSGWGALVCYAAKNYGVTALGVTLSEQQASYAQEKVVRLGLQDKVRIELTDYSTLEGEFDKVASIGMHEHIGIANYPTYYNTIERLLRRGGLYLHHAITLRARKDDAAFRKKQRKDLSALTKYIFPGGELDYIGNTVTSLERHGFEVHDVECWRWHYHVTCKHWHDRLLANYAAAVAEVGEVKTRLWLSYLASCSIAFDNNSVSIYQTLTSKRMRGRPPDVPATRDDLYR